MATADKATNDFFSKMNSQSNAWEQAKIAKFKAAGFTEEFAKKCLWGKPKIKLQDREKVAKIMGEK